jgi:CBS domain-containing protein
MKSESPERLPVRARRISHGNGESESVLTVYCAHRDQSLPLSECGTCEHCRDVRLDPSGRDSFLSCNCPRVRLPEFWGRVVKRLLPAAAGQTPLSQVMTRVVQCVTPDVSVETLTALLLELGISGVPVVDGEGHPIGMASKTDLIREQHTEGDTLVADVDFESGFHTARIARATVADIMMPVAFTLEETAPLSYAAALMATEGVHRLPIVGNDGKVVGILSALDVLRWLAEETGSLARF